MIEQSVIPPKKPVVYKEVAVMPPRSVGEMPEPVTDKPEPVKKPKKKAK